MPRGAYHFMYWCRPAHEQAAWFRRNVPNDPNALPPVLDLEWNGHSRTCPMKLPREQALVDVKLMLKEMEAHTGKRPIIYTDITFHRDVLEGELHDYAHWVRSVAAEPQERYVPAGSGRCGSTPPPAGRPASRKKWTPTPSTAARPNGRSFSPPIATPATSNGSRGRRKGAAAGPTERCGVRINACARPVKRGGFGQIDAEPCTRPTV